MENCPGNLASLLSRGFFGICASVYRSATGANTTVVKFGNDSRMADSEFHTHV